MGLPQLRAMVILLELQVRGIYVYIYIYIYVIRSAKRGLIGLTVGVLTRQ